MNGGRRLIEARCDNNESDVMNAVVVEKLRTEDDHGQLLERLSQGLVTS